MEALYILHALPSQPLIFFLNGTTNSAVVLHAL